MRVARIILVLVPPIVILGWVRSYYIGDSVERKQVSAWLQSHPFDPAKTALHEVTKTLRVFTFRGSISFGWGADEFTMLPSDFPERSPHGPQVNWQWSSDPVSDFSGGFRGHWSGFGYRHLIYPLAAQLGWQEHGPYFLQMGGDDIGFIVPYWAVLTATLVPFLVPIIRAFRRRRLLGHDLCHKCGYDLRAHVAGQPCPECGTPKGAGQMNGKEDPR